MLSSTEIQPDFDSLTGQGFLSVWNYPNNTEALPTEVGNVYNIRILTSSEAPVARAASAASRDVYYNTVVGKQAIEFVAYKSWVIDLEFLAA